MRPGVIVTRMKATASFTAETMALQRAFESHRPAARRLCYDPYADAFLRPSLRVVAMASGIPLLRRLVTGAYDAIGGPGPRLSAAVRTKVIDDAVTAARDAAGQCVLLGAGYDTRAYRLPGLRECRVFEVDHPATQTAKRNVIGALGLGDAHVMYVPVDFECDDLVAELDAAGFDRATATMFLWEGVTNYLTGDAVDATLAAIHTLAQAGGLLVLTYIDVRALDNPSPFPEARRWVKAVARAGEPWTFGLRPSDVEAFFTSRGFHLRQDTSTLDAGRTWFAAQRRPERGSALYRIAVAGTEAEVSG